MKVFTDNSGKVHMQGRGDARKQLKEVESIINYLQDYANGMYKVAGLALEPNIVKAERAAVSGGKR